MVTKLRQYLRRYAARRVIEKSASNVNDVLEVVRTGDQIMLNSANTNYSFGGLHRVFQKAFREVKPEDRGLKDVLILGFGVGSVATILQEELKIKCMITGVEKDAEVIRIGKDHFHTSRFKDVELVEGDASTYVKEEKKLYDLIIVDVYVDFEVPESCESEIFVNDLNRCLTKGGLILFNKLVYNHEAGTKADELLGKFNSLPGKTKVIKTRENVVNKIIVFEKE